MSRKLITYNIISLYADSCVSAFSTLKVPPGMPPRQKCRSSSAHRAQCSRTGGPLASCDGVCLGHFPAISAETLAGAANEPGSSSCETSTFRRHYRVNFGREPSRTALRVRTPRLESTAVSISTMSRSSAHERSTGPWLWEWSRGWMALLRTHLGNDSARKFLGRRRAADVASRVLALAVHFVERAKNPPRGIDFVQIIQHHRRRHHDGRRRSDG